MLTVDTGRRNLAYARRVRSAYPVACAGRWWASRRIQLLAAREVPSRWRALAECGVAKGADYERKCQRFSRTERSTWREYDGPGAGAPREWELPRSYD